MAEEKNITSSRQGYRRQKKGDDLSSVYTFGKVQPQALPLEEAVLGAIMLDKMPYPLF